MMKQATGSYGGCRPNSGLVGIRYLRNGPPYRRSARPAPVSSR